MRKIVICLFLFSLVCIRSEAQQSVPVIKAGTRIDYKYSLYGQSSVIGVTVKSVTDSIELEWNMRGYAFGSYLISGTGFENGTKINFIQPAPQTVLRLAPDETFAVISKAAFKALKKDKKFVYNNTTYVLKDDNKDKPFKSGDQELDVLHVTGLEEAGDMWILNNPGFPLICQFKNNPLGINFTVTAIK
ncbi:MAG TPA: hypothetical protein VGC08_11210 [Pedobacter sp.]